jgi:hypothetical protein
MDQVALSWVNAHLGHLQDLSNALREGYELEAVRCAQHRGGGGETTGNRVTALRLQALSSSEESATCCHSKNLHHEESET